MTYQFGLIGYPIKYSLSPKIHKQFFQATGLKGEYHLHEIGPNDSFEREIMHLKDKKLDGFNVTVPYKQKIIPYLDEVDTDVLAIGAVNTVKCHQGKWIGYNTDGIGYVQALQETHPGFVSPQKKCLIIGAGGAARAIYVTLSKQGFVKIDIANRTKKHAEEIATLGEKYTRTNVLTLKQAETNLGNYDILIQTTTVGMRPNANETVLSLENMKAKSIASDIVYQPKHTTFIQHAEQKGASILYGHWMLLYQAKCAFQKWTNRNVEGSHLENALQHILEGR